MKRALHLSHFDFTMTALKVFCFSFDKMNMSHYFDQTFEHREKVMYFR